jgi:hypothetical protein
MDDLGDPFDSLAAWFRGWGRKQHSSVAGDCAGCSGTSVDNQAAESGAVIGHRRRQGGQGGKGTRGSFATGIFSPCLLVPLSPCPLAPLSLGYRLCS